MKPIVAMDIGGTNMRIALIDEQYHLLQVMRFPTVVGDKDAFMNQIGEVIKQLDVDSSTFEAISIGVPGRVRFDGHIDTLPNIKIQDVDLLPYLRRRFHVPVYIRNDAEVAALAEANLGVGKRFSRMFFVTISTGVGGALINERHLVYSSDEIGHTVFPYASSHYEFEKIASGTGIINLCKLHGLEIQASSLFFSLVNSGNPVALKIFSDWLDLMSRFFTNIQHLFEPDIIALTGGVMKSRDIFFDKLVKRLPKVHLVPAEFGDDAGLMGAALYAYQQLNVNLIKN